ncbi:NAD/NADP octopine/nopaline dehydrogenase [Nitratireductor sp. CAU 1489]|uniref:2-dehydropantoate 2-reductase n=1 Tax=Nitratireductor arenosus TaxID=2682096 RepID=A0A844QIK8_9HYPH|nr:NAD/NADP octopine/nopaline dehydrogenase family protein [Nitratireductor arenosus]MVA99027.1 NAD/NADP octopine/nopaline dehydrogenase [Nitratireductor arenosus]
MRILVIGAGNGGAAAAVELSLAGHEVRLYARSASTLEPFSRDGIGFTGVLGEGRLRPFGLGSDLAAAIADVEAAVVALPVYAHGAVARALAEAGWGAARPIILNPGHTGGVFEFETAYRAVRDELPPVAEFSTLAYVARKPRPDVVNVTGRAKALRAASLPSGRAALELACALFPGAYDSGDVIATGLSNVNMIVHPPGAMLGASWSEATGGDFTFYVQGMTSGVMHVMRALDAERIAVAAAFGHTLPTVIGEMRALGTVPADADPEDYGAIASGAANRLIKAPDSLDHRYYVEDFGHGLVPFTAIARIAGVPTPVADALIALCAIARGSGQIATRGAAEMGLVGWSRDALLARVGVAST